MAYAGATASYHVTDLSNEILDAAAAAIVAVDREGNVVRCNRAVEGLTGISTEEIRKLNFEQCVVFPADIDRWKLETARAFDGLFARWLEIRWNCREGRPRRFACSFAPVRDPLGKVRCVACTAIPCYSGEFLADRALELREIGRFLHDTIAQELAVLSCSLAPIETVVRGQPVHQDATAALEMAGRCCRDIRIVTSMLAAPVSPARKIERAIEQIADYLREEAGLVMVLDIDPVSGALIEEARMLIFTAFQLWTAQELRRNPKPRLTVRLRERRRGVVLELETAGGAFEGRSGGSGWSVIRERARTLGGEFNIRLGAAALRVRLVLPVPRGS